MNIKKTYSNRLAEIIVRDNPRCSFLDKNNILWKIINGEWIGKRSVWTKDRAACWLEDTVTDNIKSLWCGENADYKEIFKTNEV